MSNLYLDPQWQKIVRDLWENKARTLLVVVAIAVGVFAFGSMFAARNILLDNMQAGVLSSNQATLTYSMPPFEPSLARTVTNFPYVREVEARTTALVQVETPTGWMPLQLIATPDLARGRINRIALDEGTLSVQRREIVFERASMVFLQGMEPGSTIQIEMPDGTQQEMTIAGVAHDFSALPAVSSQQLTGYLSLDSLRAIGLSDQSNELLIVTTPEFTTQAQLEIGSKTITEMLGRYGHPISSVTITEPGKHWAADFISALVLILAVLGAMSLVLSGFLVVNTITAILSQQKRQIGMIKAVGGITTDILAIYLTMAASFGILSLFIALPVGVGLSYALTRILAGLLNIDIYNFNFPLWVLGAQSAVALIAPLAAAVVPILGGTRTTVREAISDYGITGSSGGFIDRLLLSFRSVPRPLMLSLRNTFRRRGRLALTMVTLVIAGAIFISIINTRNALLGQFDKFVKLFGYDIQISLAEPEHVSRLIREAQRIEGVERVEGWGGTSGTIVRPPGVVVGPIAPSLNDSSSARRPNNGMIEMGQRNADQGTPVSILAPPIDTQFIEPDLSEGRWFVTGDYDAIVLSTEVLRTEPYLKIGDRVTIDFGGKERELTIIGVANVIGLPIAYVPFDYVTRLNGTSGLSSLTMISSSSDDAAEQNRIAREVEERFKDIGIPVAQVSTLASLLGAAFTQIDSLIILMLVMAAMLGLVGGLGLASTMSLNVLERTREIGVMRSIGASNGSIRSIFLTEGLLIGVMSCLLGSALSVPISYILCTALGNIFFQRPLDLILKPWGFVLWTAIALSIAAVASLLPANRASSITVRESIAYE
jgi:putative ABC transport system permease protein